MKKAVLCLLAVVLLFSLQGCASAPEHWYGAYDEVGDDSRMMLLTPEFCVFEFDGNPCAADYEVVDPATLHIKDESYLSKADVDVKLRNGKLTADGTVTMLDKTLQVVVYYLNDSTYQKRKPLADADLPGTLWHCITAKANQEGVDRTAVLDTPYLRGVRFSQGEGIWGLSDTDQDPFTYEISGGKLTLHFARFDAPVTGQIVDDLLTLTFPEYTAIYYR